MRGTAQLSGTSNLTLTAGDWCFIIGIMSNGDSLQIVTIKKISDTLTASSGNFNTQVRVNGIATSFIYDVYTTYKSINTTLFEQVGMNINTQIKAISNQSLQSAISAFDTAAIPVYQSIRRRGKNIALDH